MTSRSQVSIQSVPSKRPRDFTMIPSLATYNPGWNCHYSPATVDFFDFAVEVCDATIPASRSIWTRTAARRWCSELVGESPAP
ncbi:BP74-related protein [Sphaerisporangium siamense]|uniref:BP74-related protein n=1 Tax=Sphaerisporangium siamense TaxID=795645 RepID=UPI00403A84E2